MKKSLIYISVLCLILLLTGCKVKTVLNKKTNKENNTKAQEIIDAFRVDYDSNPVDNIHELSIELTNKYFIKDSKTEYKIVITEDKNDYYTFAIKELKNFLKEATNIEFEVINDNESLDKTGKYIYLGRTSNAKLLGYTDEILSYDNSSAYVIKTNGDSIYLVGASKFGDLYSVYDFLTIYFNYQIYAIDTITITKNVKEQNFLNINLLEVPDFEYRQTTHGEENYDSVFKMRMRMQSESDLFIPLNGETFHNWLNLIPYSKYKNTHPEWFNKDHSNLNLVTLNDKGESVIDESLLNEVFNNIKEYIVACPDGLLVGYTQEDGSAWGTNEATNNNYTKYGVHSVESVEFEKRLAELINSWLSTEYKERKIRIFDFAYSHTFEAPVRKTSSDTYELMKESLKLPSYAGILFCTFDSNDYFPFTDSINENTKENFTKWKMVSENLYVWSYYTNFKNFFLPVDCFNSLKENNKFLYEMDTIYIYNQFGHTQPMGSDWYRLKEYLSSKLSFNVNLNVNDLYEEFFDNYFMDASDTMFEFFNQERDWFKHLSIIDSDLVMLRKDNNFSKNYWPKELLKGWLKLFEKAYQEIDYLKELDYELYTKLYDHIAAESISIRYLYVKLYSADLTDTEYNNQVQKVLEDALRVGFTRASESEYTLENVF